MGTEALFWAAGAVLLAAVAGAAYLGWQRYTNEWRGYEADASELPLVFPVPQGGANRPQPRTAPRFAEAAAPVADIEELDDHGELFDGKTIRFYRPRDLTLQLLPGWLEVVEGEDRGQAIRFVRPAGRVPELTFGRNEGPRYQHLQLRAHTVSREHARMRLENGRWLLCNLSRTNPVVVNGTVLGDEEPHRELRGGDRIEMGEVVFRFHDR